MKKLTLSLLFGISLLFTTQSYEFISVLDSHPHKDCLYKTLKHVLKDMGKDNDIPKDALIEVPKYKEDQFNSGELKLLIPEHKKAWIITVPEIEIKLDYVERPYNRLLSYERELLKKLEQFKSETFDRNERVLIIGVYNEQKKETYPGSITVNGKTELLKWENKYIWDIFENKVSQISSCPSVQYQSTKGIYISEE